MIYYGCRYFPVLAAAVLGQECRMINEEVENMEEADRVAHSNLCGYAKAVLTHVLQDEVREVVLTSCCDCMRRTADLLNTFGHLDYLYVLDLPHDDATCAKKFYAGQIRRFIEDYAAWKGVRPVLPLSKSLMRRFSSPPVPPETETEPYLLLTGARASTELLERIREGVPLPVRNETCSGTVRIPQPVPEYTDLDAFCNWYSDVLLSQPACMRMNHLSGKNAGLNAPGCRGVIYHTIKFCDFYPFEYANLTGQVDVPMTKIETDFTPQSSGQMLTRIESLAERLHLPGTVPVRHSSGKYVIGVDSGSTSTNAVLMDRHDRLVAGISVPTGVKIEESASAAVEQVLEQAGVSREELDGVVTTGYGRNGISCRDDAVTEISCHARGAFWLNPATRTVIDIGGQDNKVIAMDDQGNVTEFVMNDKCAAGTGRFLDNMARVMGMSLDEMSRKGLTWQENLTISSMCTVFAESEVVSLIAEQKSEQDIIHGLNQSIASKVVALSHRVPVNERVMLTGGVSRNPGVIAAMEEQLNTRLIVPGQAQLAGAIGAALYAREG